MKSNGELYKVFFELQNFLKPDFVIEVGAYKAEFSFGMANKFGIDAVAFEANPKVFKFYTEEKNIYEFYKNTNGYKNTNMVDYLNIAISDHVGDTKINAHQRGVVGNSSLKTIVNGSIIESFTVNCTTLDDYFKNIEFSNAALWIDAEGSNGEILQGATETLKKCRSIFIETEDGLFWHNAWQTPDVKNFLKQNGFNKIAEENIYVEQKNHIFIKEIK
jgi:FkbM family methyltransferase